MSRISKTVITFTVLHETEDPLHEDIEGVLYECDTGNAVGLVTDSVTVAVPDDQVEAELIALGNDGEFFNAARSLRRGPKAVRMRRISPVGYNTNITIINDALDILRRHPGEFVEGIERHLFTGAGSFGVGNHANPVYVQRTEHADVTQLIAAGGNFSTKLASLHHVPSHHTDEGQVAILRAWAAQLGYDIKPRKGRVE